MALPNNIKQVKLPNNSVYEIIPERLKNGTYQASLPTLTADVILATTANLSNYVPYSGASSNVDIGSHSLAVQTLGCYAYGNNQSIYCGGFGVSTNGDLTVEGSKNIILEAVSGCYIGSVSSSYEIATKGDISNLVPYSGATSNVNLGSKNFSASTITATNYLGTPYVSATSAIIWNYMQLNDDGNDSQDAPRPSNIIGYQDPDVYMYGTGVTVYDANTEAYTQLAYPSSSGTFATEEWVSSHTGSGTVTSVALRNGSTSQNTLSISGSPITSSGTIDITLKDAYGDNKNPYGSKSAHYVLAGPSTGSAAPTFRALAKADIPSLDYLPLTGGTLTSTSTPILTLKKSTASAGAFIGFKANNQDAKVWYAGQDSSNNFRISYTTDGGTNNTKELELNTSGDLIVKRDVIAQAGYFDSDIAIGDSAIQDGYSVNLNNNDDGLWFEFYGYDEGHYGTILLPGINGQGQIALTSDINNATLTIQQNSTTVNTFTANASSNVTANIITPQVYRYI